VNLLEFSLLAEFPHKRGMGISHDRIRGFEKDGKFRKVGCLQLFICLFSYSLQFRVPSLRSHERHDGTFLGTRIHLLIFNDISLYAIYNPLVNYKLNILPEPEGFCRWFPVIECGLVVRVLGYRSRGPGSILGTAIKKSSGSGTGSTQPREYN
jgi:hypothetical protein